jgi:anionic cell wall polymer biosynthesis LytR-Cps2A-Psr (LCP) family protein
VVSVSRDAQVAIPGRGTDKLNAAYAFGGFALTSKTLNQLTGVRFDGGAVVDMDGMRQLVDTLGGLDLYVDEKVASIHVGYTRDGRQQAPFDLSTGQLRPVKGVTPQVYQVGYHHLTGAQVVDYARQRFLIPDGEEGRQRHVRQVFSAVLGALRSNGTLTDPVRFTRFLNALNRSVTIDTGGLGMEQLVGGLGGISDPVGLQTPTRLGKLPGEVRLTADATSLFAALAGDDLAGWIATHPAAVAPTRGP